MRVFADDGDCHAPLGLLDQVDNLVPSVELGRGGVEAEMLTDLPVEAFGMVGAGYGINRVYIERRNDPALPQITEQRNLFARGRGNRALAAAQQNVWLNAEAEQFLRGMLSRLGLELARRGDPRHQCQMHKEDALASELVAELANRLEKRQALDVADRAA